MIINNLNNQTVTDNEAILFSCKPKTGIIWYLINVYCVFYPIVAFLIAAFFIPKVGAYLLTIYEQLQTLINNGNLNTMITNIALVGILFVMISWYIYRKLLMRQQFDFYKDKCVLLVGFFLIRRRVIMYDNFKRMEIIFPIVLFVQQLTIIRISTAYDTITLYGIRKKDADQIKSIVKAWSKNIDAYYSV